ncbi:MAG: hypothetical protein ACF8PN_07050 [Phycisphaerales bacterium]
MAKMFYTLEEAAGRLGKTPDEVTQMAESGQIQEFRDREKLMFKKEQIDLLAGGDDESMSPEESGELEIIGLADSGESFAIEDKEESVLGLEDSKESTGVSIFDADELETADPAAATQISDTVAPAPEFALDNQGSGSGLLDLTRESDDTSLGAVLDDINLGDDNLDEMGAGGASGLFESDTPEADSDAAAGQLVMPTVVEAYDPAWSGAGVGFAIGALAALVISCFILLTAFSGAVAQMATTFADNYWIVVGAFGGVTLILGVVGYFIGRATG